MTGLGGIDLSIVIPSYNEESRLPPTVHRVLAWMDAAPVRSELVLVDDGSRDSTGPIIRGAADRDRRVVPVLRERNAGKGASLRSGVTRTRGRRIVFFDADISYPLESITLAMERIDRGADLVIGARDLARQDSRRLHYSMGRRAATRGFNRLVEGALALGIPDTQCGFKAFEGKVGRQLFEQLTIDTFAFDIELLVLARSWSLVVERIPIEMSHAPGSTIRLLRDSLRMIRDVGRVWARQRAGLLPPRP